MRVETTVGRECWFDDSGNYHREDGPAITWNNGDREYWLHGLPHRLDGPAVDWETVTEWWVNGVRVYCKDNEEFLRVVKIISFL
jgi:hypothetical protein